MAKEQPNAFDLLPRLGSTDLSELEQVKSLLQETLVADKGALLLNSLVEYFLETNSSQAVDILSSVREPHDKHLLDKMNECMGKQSSRLSTLTLLGHVVRKQPQWIHKIARFPLFASLLKCLKADTDVVVLITGVLVLITLLPMIPQTNKQLLCEFFDIFGRLAAWNQRHPGNAQGVYAVHLHASVYLLFHRLYGMYPCNFVSYLRAHYGMKENVDTFEELVKPMLEHVRIHPELITGTKDYEVDPIRWKRFEPHDIVIECGKVSLDPKEASSEEGYSSLSDHIRRPVDHSRSCFELSIHEMSPVTPIATVRQSLSRSLPFLTATKDSGSGMQTSNHQQSDELNSSGGTDGMWSPSSICGMSTPPSSRMSPATVSESSHSASHLSGRLPNIPVDGKLSLSPSTPSGSSPLPSFSEELGQPAQNTSSTQSKVNPAVKELKKVVPNSINNGGDSDAKSPVSLAELHDIFKRTGEEREDDGITEEILSLTHGRLDFMARPGLESSLSGSSDTLLSSNSKPNLVSTPDRGETSVRGGEQHPPWPLWPALTPIENGKGSLSKCSLSDLTKEPMPYEPLFDLALPKVACLFLERKNAEALQRVEGEREMHREEIEGEDLSVTSPLEVLDRVIQQGHDTHEKVLKRTLASQVQSADLNSGGKQHSNKGKGPPSAASDELGVLHSQMLLLHSQLLYERHKREQHALRNRRLFGRIVNATALEEQNNSMKAQLKLQDVEMQTVQKSLQKEQQRSKHMREEREALVKQLQAQIQQLQQERNNYYSKMLQLQSDLQENQKKVGEMEAELRRANNKVCNMGHLLSQLSIKVNNSESMEQQMAFLNKQLLLLGEANRLYMEEIERLGPEANKELKMQQVSSLREVERLRQSSTQQSQRLEAAQQRIIDLENLLTKKEQIIRDQKKMLENVKSQATEQLQASDNRYLAQKHITQVLQSELLELYSQMELKKIHTSSPADSISEPSSSTDQRPKHKSTGPSPSSQSADPIKRDEGAYMCFNGEVSASSSHTPPTALINGSQEEDLSAFARSFSSLPCDSPLAVGSYPSTGSFLGKRARELFRNKSESHHEEEPAAPISLSQDLKVEDPLKNMELEGPNNQADLQPMDRPRAYNIHRRRHQDLRIMDYNETHHEH